MDPKNDPFVYGDGTLMQLREQPWQFDDLGTQVIGGRPLTVAAEEPIPQLPPEIPILDDPIVRIERKLDDLTHIIHALQRRLDSIDAAIARVVARS